MSLHRPSRDPDRPTGQVVEILERKPLILVGSFESAATLFHLAPDDPVYPDRIPLRIGKDADRLPRHGDKIVAEIRGSRDLDSAPRARLVEVLGARHEPGVDMLCILKRYRLAEEFPSEVAEEVRALGGGIEPEDLEGRRDCRKDLVATIDPEDAKDFDDAFHLHRTREGSGSCRSTSPMSPTTCGPVPVSTGRPSGGATRPTWWTGWSPCCPSRSATTSAPSAPGPTG